MENSLVLLQQDFKLPTGIVGGAGLAKSYEGTVRNSGLPTERPEAFASAGVSWCR